MINAAIFGATGYTGSELVRFIKGHPKVELLDLSAESNAGEAYSKIHPQFRERIDLKEPSS